MQKQRYTKWVMYYAKKYWFYLIILFLVSIGVVFFALISPLPLKFLADNVFGNEPAPSFLSSFSKETLLIIAALSYIVIYGLQSIYGMFQALIMRKFSQRIDKLTLKESADAVDKIPFNDPRRLDSGSYLYQITNQSQQLSELLFGNVIQIAQSLLILVGIIVILAKINYHLMLLTFITMPLLAVCVVYFGKKLEQRSNDTETAHSKVYAFINETLTKLRTIQAFALGGQRQSQLDELVDNRNKTAMSQLKTSQLFDLNTQFIILIGTSIAIIIGGKSVFSGVMTFGGLLIFISYINDVFDQINGVVLSIGGIKEQAASLQQAYDTIIDSENTDYKSGILTDPIKGKVEFRKVTIVQKNQIIVDNVNLKIAAGSKVAIVGPSGSGKTALLNSLIRFIIPEKGWVLVDDKDVRSYEIDYLRKNIALIEQEPNLFSLPVDKNIAVSDPTRKTSFLDVMSASAIANSSEFINLMTEKYGSVIDDNKISGGQKQRIAIARAYYKNSPIVLMDEPTSALDKKAADIFINNVFKYFNNHTLIIITHDLALLRRIPNIYVIDERELRPISHYGGLENYSKEVSKNQT